MIPDFTTFVKTNTLQRPHPEFQRDLIVLQITGQLFFLGLTLLSLYYWKERQAFDAAHYLFEIIDRRFFYVAHQRPLGIVSQVLPLLGVWLHLPLKTVAILYSFGDILWYYLLFLWLGYGLKTRQGVIALFLIVSLTVKYSFFCPVTELLQGLAFLPVWGSLLNRSFHFRVPVLLAGLALLIFSHPLLFYPAAFVFLRWQMVTTETGKLPRIIWPAFAIILLLKLLLLDPYDHDKTFYPIVYNDYGYLKTVSFSAYTDLLKVIVQNYSLVCILFTGTLTLLFIKAKVKEGLLLLFAISGYLLLIIATHRFTAISNYSERMLLPVPAMLAVSVAGVLRFTTSFVQKLAAYIFLVLILLLHFDFLRITAKPYSLRVKQIESVIGASRQLGIQKGIVSEELMEQCSFAMTGWSYSMESLWLSALKGPEASITIAMQRDHIDRIRAQGHTLNEKQWVKWAEQIHPVHELNSSYFKLPEGPYRSLYKDGKANTGTATVTLAHSEKINNHNMALAFDIHMPEGNTFFCNDSSFLQLQFPDGPAMRFNIPYHLKGRGTVWMEVPLGLKHPEEAVSVFLLSGHQKVGQCRIVYRQGHFTEEKP